MRRGASEALGRGGEGSRGGEGERARIIGSVELGRAGGGERRGGEGELTGSWMRGRCECALAERARIGVLTGGSNS